LTAKHQKSSTALSVTKPVYAQVTTIGFASSIVGVGFTYLADADVFVAPQPYPSWTLDSNHDWQPPTPMPVEEGKEYAWFEPNKQWIELA
jgi:hypothetical protein